jgi:hypothetical protein
MWYGLLRNGELISVQQFNREPLIFDFHIGFFSSRNEYEIIEVGIYNEETWEKVSEL